MMYCKNCGSQISDSEAFCANCGTPAQQPLAQQAQQYQPAYGQAPAMIQDKGVYGRFGGLFIYGALIFIILIIGMLLSRLFLDSTNLTNIGRQLMMLLPAGFAVGLTVKTKGVDLSFPAMISISSVIMIINEGSAFGIILAFAVCIIIGAINAVGIHFLKLPGLLVTLVMFMVLSFISNVAAAANVRIVTLDIALGWIYALAAIAAIVAVLAALLSSISKDNRNKFWPTLIVYASSGILAVIYFFGLSVRLRSMTFYNQPYMINTLLFIAIFLSITRFFKSKTLGIVFAIIPCLLNVLISNALNLASISSFFQQTFFSLFVTAMLFLIFYRGRSHLEGQNLSPVYKTKSWVAIIPLFLPILRGIILTVIVVANNGISGSLYYAVAGIGFSAFMLIATIGICIWYALMKPKESTIV